MYTRRNFECATVQFVLCNYGQCVVAFFMQKNGQRQWSISLSECSKSRVAGSHMVLSHVVLRWNKCTHMCARGLTGLNSYHDWHFIGGMYGILQWCVSTSAFSSIACILCRHGRCACMQITIHTYGVRTYYLQDELMIKAVNWHAQMSVEHKEFCLTFNQMDRRKKNVTQCKTMRYAHMRYEYEWWSNQIYKQMHTFPFKIDNLNKTPSNGVFRFVTARHPFK